MFFCKHEATAVAALGHPSLLISLTQFICTFYKTFVSKYTKYVFIGIGAVSTCVKKFSAQAYRLMHGLMGPPE